MNLNYCPPYPRPPAGTFRTIDTKAENERNKQVIEIYCGMGERNTVACNNCANRAVHEHFNFAQLYLRTDKVKINEQKTSIATEPLYLYTVFDAI